MSIGVGEGIELSATACTLLNNNKLGVTTYITTLKLTSKMHFFRELVWIATYACIVYVRLGNFSTKPRFKNLNLLIHAISEFPGPLFQNEVTCSAFDMKTIFYSHANKTHFHKKACALGLILKVRVLGAREWSIVLKEFSCTKKENAKKVVHKRRLVVKSARLT